MKAFSARYPGVLFKLERIGEETDDHEMAYFMNGGSQLIQATITFADPDMSKFPKAKPGVRVNQDELKKLADKLAEEDAEIARMKADMESKLKAAEAQREVLNRHRVTFGN